MNRIGFKSETKKVENKDALNINTKYVIAHESEPIEVNADTKIDDERYIYSEENLILDIKGLRHDKDIFKEAIKTMAEIYNIDKSDMVSILTKASQNLSKNKGVERSL